MAMTTIVSNVHSTRPLCRSCGEALTGNIDSFTGVTLCEVCHTVNVIDWAKPKARRDSPSLRGMVEIVGAMKQFGLTTADVVEAIEGFRNKNS